MLETGGRFSPQASRTAVPNTFISGQSIPVVLRDPFVALVTAACKNSYKFQSHLAYLILTVLPPQRHSSVLALRHASHLVILFLFSPGHASSVSNGDDSGCLTLSSSFLTSSIVFAGASAAIPISLTKHQISF